MFKDAEAAPGISGVMISIPQGGLVTRLPEGDKYIGFIFANGENPAIVEGASRKAHKRLEFELDEITRVWLLMRGEVAGNAS